MKKNIAPFFLVANKDFTKEKTFFGLIGTLSQIRVGQASGVDFIACTFPLSVINIDNDYLHLRLLISYNVPWQ